MDDINPRLMEVFFEVQRGLPRQGPGSNGSTIKALELCSELPDNPTVLDIGCGNGHIGQQLLNLGYKVYGCDIANSNIKQSKNKGIIGVR